MSRKLKLEDCYKCAKEHDGKFLGTVYINNLTKMPWECENKHIFYAPIKTVKKGHWCPECAGNIKLTQDMVEDFINKKGGVLLSNYISSGEKLKVKCLKCQHIWYTPWDNIKCGHWCPKCVNIAPVDIKYINKFVKKKNGIILDSSNYKNARSKIKVKCLKDEHTWQTTWDYLKQGNWCPKCAGKILLNYKELCQYVSDKNGIVLQGPIENIKHNNKFKIKCLKDNYEWIASYYSLIYNESWCPKCTGCILKSFDEVKSFVENKNGKLLSGPADLKNNVSKLKVSCIKNHEWEISYKNLMSGKWCPKCISYESQKILFNIISKIFNEVCEFNYRKFDWLKNKKNLEIDIWAPQIKLAIEYDGIHHFRPINYGGDKTEAKKRFDKRKKLDRLKNKLIKQHKEDIKYFVRFSYKEPLTEEYVVEKLTKHNIPFKGGDL